MSCTGGSDVQEKSSKSDLSKDKSEVGKPLPCKKNQVVPQQPVRTPFSITCLRSDDSTGIEGITVKVKKSGGAALPDKTTAKTTGTADFGEIDEASYDIALVLTEEQKKDFKPVAAQNGVAVKKGSNDKIEVKLDLIPKTAFTVTCLRSDDSTGIEGITVKVKKSGGAALPDKTTAQTTGIADFGIIEEASYDIEVELTEAQKKDFKPVAAQNGVAVKKGSNDKIEIKVDLIPKTAFTVTCIRSDDNAGIEGLTVKVKKSGGAALPDKKTAKTTGLADFGIIEEASYDIEIALTTEEEKQFKKPDAQLGVAVKKGSNDKIQIKLEPVCRLRIVVWGSDDKPLANRAWKVTAPGNANGTTGNDGLIEIASVPLTVVDGKVEITWRDPAPPVQPVVVNPQVVGPNDAAVYPRKIVVGDFKDKDDKPSIPPKEDNVVTWTLTIDNLDKYEDDEGLRARLFNLGFGCNAGAQAAVIQRAVKAYQKKYLNQDNGSGVIGDIKVDLKNRHEKP